MVLTFRYRVRKPSNLPALARTVNLVWNYCGDVQNQAKRWSRKWPTGFDLINLTKASRELGLLSDSIGAICLQFAKSRDAARHRPRWRVSSGKKRSLGWIPFGHASRVIKFDGDSVIFQKRRYRLWLHRPVEGRILCGSFSEDARGRWYLNLQCEVEAALPTGSGEVGIDLGLKTLATLSDGSRIDRERITERFADVLAIAQRAGRTKRVRAIHAKIRNVRQDLLHRASNAIASKYERIVVGNVNAAQLARTRLAKSVFDVSWSSFRRQLAYKAIRHQATYVEADERFSTQRCSECGNIGGPKGIAALGVRDWICGGCGVLHDRDVNAARNILSGQNAGLQMTGT